MGLFEAKTPNTAQKVNILFHCKNMQSMLNQLLKQYPSEARLVQLNNYVNVIKKECEKIK